MTQDEIIRMAREAGMDVGMTATIMCSKENLERFANLVAEARKEKAAKVAGSYDASVWSHCPKSSHAADMVSSSIAAAIRGMK